MVEATDKIDVGEYSSTLIVASLAVPSILFLFSSNPNEALGGFGVAILLASSALLFVTAMYNASGNIKSDVTNNESDDEPKDADSTRPTRFGYGSKGLGSKGFDHTTKEGLRNVKTGEEMVEYGTKFPSVGGKEILTTIEGMAVERDEIHVSVYTPDGVRDTSSWTFQYPHIWDKEGGDNKSRFPIFASKLGYTRNNFNEMVGEPVVLRRKPENDKFDTLVLETPENVIENRLEDGEFNYIQFEAIIEQFDIDIPEVNDDNPQIVVEDSPIENIDDWQ